MRPILPIAAAAAVFALLCDAQPAVINAAWGQIIKPLSLSAGFQLVVNSATSAEGPYSAQVYQKIAELGAPYQRYVPWLPYPRMGIAELEPPSHGGICGFVNSGGPGNIWSTTLDCGKYGAGTIDAVTFADYGLPTGYCDALSADQTCTKDVRAAVAAACVGKASCTLLSSDATFGAAPCAGNRLAVRATCSNKTVTAFTYWDFALPDQGMKAFLTAADSANRTAIPNFSTIPNFFFANVSRTFIPDDPLGETWSYERGSELVDPSGAAVGDYYGRLLAYYTQGGFEDEAGRWIANPNEARTFSHWEVLNEVNSEHHMSPAFYTILYDSIIEGIRKWCPIGCAHLKFFGLGGAGEEYVPYFLNRSNHRVPSTPIDFITIHSYAGSAQRDGGDNASDYTAFFTHQESFINSIASVKAVIAASDYPGVLIDADEVGVILPDDNDPKYTSMEPGFPAIYWNAAAAMYAELFGRGAVVGLDVLGCSQLIGYPSLPFQRGPPISGPWTAPPQYPSVSMLSWGGAFGNPGDGTARYWLLKLLVEEFHAGPPGGTYAPSAADQLVDTSVTAAPPTLSSPFCASVLNLDTLSMFCATGSINAITFASYGTPSGTACGSWAVNASCNAARSMEIVQAACLGKAMCSVPADTPTFGDPCYGTVKHLDVEATCSTGGGAQAGNSSGAVYAQAFVEAGGARKALVVNKTPLWQSVSLQGAAGGAWRVVDESTAYGPAAQVQLSGDTWQLAPYAAGVLRLA